MDLVDAAVRLQDDALAVLVNRCEAVRLEDETEVKSL